MVTVNALAKDGFANDSGDGGGDDSDDGTDGTEVSDEEKLAVEELTTLVNEGQMVVNLTARIGKNVHSDAPQPALWPHWTISDNEFGDIEQQSPTIEITDLADDLTLSMKGCHIQQDSTLFLNGYLVDGSIACEDGELPVCVDEIVTISLM